MVEQEGVFIHAFLLRSQFLHPVGLCCLPVSVWPVRAQGPFGYVPTCGLGTAGVRPCLGRVSGGIWSVVSWWFAMQRKCEGDVERKESGEASWFAYCDIVAHLAGVAGPPACAAMSKLGRSDL